MANYYRISGSFVASSTLSDLIGQSYIIEFATDTPGTSWTSATTSPMGGLYSGVIQGETENFNNAYVSKQVEEVRVRITSGVCNGTTYKVNLTYGGGGLTLLTFPSSYPLSNPPTPSMLNQ